MLLYSRISAKVEKEESFETKYIGLNIESVYRFNVIAVVHQSKSQDFFHQLK